MNVGILGLGFMGATHASRYARMPGVRIAAVCARDEARLNGKFSAQAGNLGFALPDLDLSATAKYRDWKLLVSDPQVHIIDICGPSDLHREAAVAALEHGKHVLCEKPMALTVEDCGQMLLAAAKADRRLMIAHVLRFWPAYEYLREWLGARSASDLTTVRFERQCGVPNWSSWLTAHEKSGGALLDLLIHDVDQALCLFGMPVAVRAQPIASSSCEDVRATMTYPNGVEVQVLGGWLEEGTPFSMGYEMEAADAGICFRGDVLTQTDAAGGKQQVDLPASDAFEKELLYFLRCCESGEPPALCPPQQSRAAVQLALWLKQSCSSGGKEILCAQ